MQKRFYTLLIVAILCTVGNVNAQRDAAMLKKLQNADNVNGVTNTIYIHPDAREAADVYYENTDRKTSFMGYRVRIFSSSNQKARKAAEQTIASFRKRFSEPVYYGYVNPNFQVNCGNFLSIDDAVVFLQKALKFYPNAHIVTCEIPANTFVRTVPASIKAAARSEIVMEEDDPRYDMLMSDEDLANDPDMAEALKKEQELMANLIEYLPSKDLIEESAAEEVATEEVVEEVATEAVAEVAEATYEAAAEVVETVAEE